MTALWRYKDTESVVKAMDGYTPGEGWVLYVPAQPTPAWHDAPTVPGLWVTETVRIVDKSQMKRIATLAHGRWYGPIPMEETK